jgi:hypothetical protein
VEGRPGAGFGLVGRLLGFEDRLRVGPALGSSARGLALEDRARACFGFADRPLGFADRLRVGPALGSSVYGFAPDFTVRRIGVPGKSKLWRIELIR